MSKNLLQTKEAPVRGRKIDLNIDFSNASLAELKMLGEDLPEGYVAGYASTSDLDHYRDVIKEGAFQESINERGLEGPKGIKFLAQHRSDKPAGVIKVLEYRNGKLWIEAQMNLSISYVNDLYQAAKMQGGLSFSVGFYHQDYEFKEDDNGMEYLLITRAELVEVSVVTFPGNDEAEMTFIKGAKDMPTPDTVAQFEKALVGLGLCKSRNGAHDVVRFVKSNLSLFVKSNEEDRIALEAPVKEKMGKTSSLIEEMKKLSSSEPSASSQGEHQ